MMSHVLSRGQKKALQTSVSPIDPDGARRRLCVAKNIMTSRFGRFRRMGERSTKFPDGYEFVDFCGRSDAGTLSEALATGQLRLIESGDHWQRVELVR